MRYLVALLTLGVLAVITIVTPGVGQTIPPNVYLPIIANMPTPTPPPTATSTPKPTTVATNTPTPTTTPTTQPTATATQALVYICDHDAYNCSDFNTQAAAQNVYNYCAVRGFGDIHKLDQDNDGEVCESLP